MNEGRPSSCDDLKPSWPRGSWRYPFVLAATILFASAQSQVVGPSFVGADKVAHFLVYGLLATLAARTQPRGRWWVGAVAASMFGLLDEAWQSFTPGRLVEVGDWVADTAGATLAVTLYCRWRWYRVLLERPLDRRRAEPRIANPAPAITDSVR